MKVSLIALMYILLLASCSTKKDDTLANRSNLSDSILFEGKYSLRRILRDDGKPIYTKETTDFYSTGGSEKTMVVKSTLSVTETPSWYPQYRLILEGYDLTNIKEPIWKKEIENESPVGILNGYFQTVQSGCCSAEDGYTLYRLDDGKQVLKFTGKFENSNFPAELYVGYNAQGSVNYVFQGDSSIIGNLYYIPSEDFDLIKLVSYLVRCKDCIEPFSHTPEIQIISKNQLNETGFFKAFDLYKRGEKLTHLDTAQNYLTLKYWKETFLIPVNQSGELLVSELTTTNKDFSKDFTIIKK